MLIKLALATTVFSIHRKVIQFSFGNITVLNAELLLVSLSLYLPFYFLLYIIYTNILFP